MQIGYPRNRWAVFEGKAGVLEGAYRGTSEFWKQVLEETAPGNGGSDVAQAGSDLIPEIGAAVRRPDGLEVLLEVTDRRDPAARWRAVAVEVLELGTGARSLWAVEPAGEGKDRDGADRSGRVFLPASSMETVCRLRVEFQKTSGFRSEELWQTDPVALPSVGATESSPLAGMVGGAMISLHSLTAPKSSAPGVFRDFFNAWAGDSHAFTLWMEVSAQGVERRLTLVSALDDQGRRAATRSGLWSGEQYAFGLTPEPGAKSLSFVFALHSSRFVDLVVDTRAATS